MTGLVSGIDCTQQSSSINGSIKASVRLRIAEYLSNSEEESVEEDEMEEEGIEEEIMEASPKSNASAYKGKRADASGETCSSRCSPVVRVKAAQQGNGGAGHGLAERQQADAYFYSSRISCARITSVSWLKRRSSSPR